MVVAAEVNEMKRKEAFVPLVEEGGQRCPTHTHTHNREAKRACMCVREGSNSIAVYWGTLLLGDHRFFSHPASRN